VILSETTYFGLKQFKNRDKAKNNIIFGFIPVFEIDKASNNGR